MTVSVLNRPSTSGGRPILDKTSGHGGRGCPRLLVSVRNEREARLAIATGVDLIDVKEPQAGPLGMAAPAEIAKIAAACRSRTPVSVAVGEIREQQAVTALPRSVWLIKAGPAGCPSAEDYFRRCEDLLPPGVPYAAVAYADWQSAAAPQPTQLAAAAIDRGIDWLLLDTFGKDGRSLLDFIDDVSIARLAARLHSGGVRLAIAGSLRAGDVKRLARCGADVVAFRTAACRAGRASTLSLGRLRLLRSLVGPRASVPGDRTATGRALGTAPASEPVGR